MHKNVGNNHHYCYIEMLEKSKVLRKCKHGENFRKVAFVIYGETEPLLKKGTCHNNPQKSSTANVNKHTACSCSLFTQ